MTCENQLPLATSVVLGGGALTTFASTLFAAATAAQWRTTRGLFAASVNVTCAPILAATTP